MLAKKEVVIYLGNKAVTADAGVKKADDILRPRGYRRVRCIGEGSSGKIWLVLYAATGELRVAKNIENVRGRLAGLRLWAGLNHPGLAAIYDIIPHGDDAICIMEYIQGRNLRDYVRECRAHYGGLSEERAAGWGIELCEILGYLHSRSPAIIYQDLKPSNIILTAEGRLRLIDPESAGCVRTGDRIVGTPGFLAPEQQEADMPDERTDIYSLGKTLIWILGSTEKGKVCAAPAMRYVLAKCTEPEKEKRFSDCRELAQALRETMRIKNRMCTFCCMIAVAVLGLGGIRFSTEDARRREEKYRFYLNQKNISDYKSAIFLFPDREEGYQQFLNYILEDDAIDRLEHQELSAVLRYTEPSFKEQDKGYESFAYRLGMAYWFCYAEDGGRRHRALWLTKFLENGTSDSEKRLCAEMLCAVSDYYECIENGTLMQQADYRSFWRKSKALLCSAFEEKDLKTALYISDEIAGFFCLCRESFLEAGITKTEWQECIVLFTKKEEVFSQLAKEEGSCAGLLEKLHEKLMLIKADETGKEKGKG